MGIHISLGAERVGSLWGLPITNTLVMGWVVTLVLCTIGIIVGTRLKMVPGKAQMLFEMAIGGVSDFMAETLDNKDLAKKVFPIIFTIFLFIFTANLVQFIPGVGSIGFFKMEGSTREFIPLFRSLNTDINTTLALAIIAFILIEVAGVAVLGFLKYFHKFVNFSSPLGFSIGIIDLFSEVARLVSFSFRLFGNIFAGEVVIMILGSFVPIILPVPLMLFEVFVGFVQAAIFALLTLIFIKIAITEMEH
jgi:F-type H+-transporting ATPase subunit a